MQCLTWLLLFVVAVFIMLSLLRWFEQTADAVDQREWDKVALLVAMPFAVWFYPSKVSAGRPTAVPHHDPVRGFGALPKNKPAATPDPPRPAASHTLQGLTDAPPPGTPKEFIGMPVIPPRGSKPARPAVDPEKLAKLKQKMREQGMLKDDEDAGT
jgi:hypothetical protein